jgi:hypothetical protein
MSNLKNPFGGSVDHGVFGSHFCIAMYDANDNFNQSHFISTK